MIAAYFALVRHPCQSARSRQNAKQRQLRETNRRRTIVHKNDFVACQRQFVTTSGGSSIAGGDKLQPGVLAGVFDAVPRFVCKFTEIYLPRMRGQPEHVNVSSGAKYAILCAGDDDRANLRMFESNAL